MNRKKAYIYTRVSTNMQVEVFSLDAQETRIQQYANAFDIEIVKTYQDAGKSGKTMLGRTEFMAMISDIEAEKDKVDYVLVFKLSCFGRNAADIYVMLGFMEIKVSREIKTRKMNTIKTITTMLVNIESR
ncbi:recombinase family protein [uncultured Streptococcus sp.]|uniref:recombinase family protein n=1 Tax=uncultured Streptococcus sp. TaxID=83427 RepID=UPI002594BDCF|nr:recombinase family protein [uncultured Streptococcus sp.]